MKTPLLSSLFVLVAALSFGQITINSSDFPGVGVSLYQGVDTVLPQGYDIGMASATAQSWDFQSLETDSLFEFTFQDPANVPNGDDFPDAEVAVDQFGGSGFVNITTDLAEIIGIAANGFQGLNVSISEPFDDPYQLMSFPSTYGTSFSDEAMLDITLFNDGFIPSFPPLFDPDSVRFKRVSSITAEVDAHGTATDALGNSHDVLRQVFIEESVDTAWYYQNGSWAMIPALVFPNPNFDTTRNVRFLSLQLGYAVADFNVNSDLEPYRSTFLSDPSLCCTSVEEVELAELDLVYPNPSNGTLSIGKVSANATFEMLDLSGKTVFTQNVYSNGRVDASRLPKGLYLFRIREGEGSAKVGRLALIN